MDHYDLAVRLSRSRIKLLGYAAATLMVIGVVGYVGGRFMAAADYRFIQLVFFSTYIELAGVALAALDLVLVSSRTRRPIIPRALAVLGVLWGILVVLFPYSRAFAYASAAVAAVGFALLVIGWKDLSDPKLWSSSAPESTSASS